MQIELGDEVKCLLTGFQGVASARIIPIEGVERWSVQPPVNERGEIPSAYDIDGTALAIVTKAKAPTQPAADDSAHPKLGDEVEDTLTGFRGFVTAKVIQINGCTIYSVQPKILKPGKYADRVGFLPGRLKIRSKSQAPEAQKKTGGAMTKSERF